MENYIQAEDYELWMLIKNGPLVPKKTKEDGTTIVKKPEEFDSEDYKMMEKTPKLRNSYTLVLVQMSIQEFLSVNLLKISEMLYKWLMKVPIR